MLIDPMLLSFYMKVNPIPLSKFAVIWYFGGSSFGYLIRSLNVSLKSKKGYSHVSLSM